MTQRIRAALQRIDAHHAALCRHLAATVHTGVRCVYAPAAGAAVGWVVEGG